jgi:hypothetical protein
MMIKRSVSLLVLPVVLAVSAVAGIAQAGDIDVRNGGTRVTIGDNGDIKVRQPGQRIDVRDNSSDSGWWNPRILSFPLNKKTISCRGGTYSSQSTRTSGSGGTYSRTTTSTTNCR